jgi:hypothetical protein
VAAVLDLLTDSMWFGLRNSGCGLPDWMTKPSSQRDDFNTSAGRAALLTALDERLAAPSARLVRQWVRGPAGEANGSAFSFFSPWSHTAAAPSSIPDYLAQVPGFPAVEAYDGCVENALTWELYGIAGCNTRLVTVDTPEVKSVPNLEVGRYLAELPPSAGMVQVVSRKLQHLLRVATHLQAQESTLSAPLLPSHAGAVASSPCDTVVYERLLGSEVGVVFLMLQLSIGNMFKLCKVCQRFACMHQVCV